VFQQVATQDGKVLLTRQDIQDGQNVWQAMGGQEVGSVWGHGSYAAPDWTADWVHREAEFYLNTWANREHGVSDYHKLPPEELAALQARLTQLMRSNTYDARTRTLTISPLRAQAIQAVGNHYSRLFGNDPTAGIVALRDHYAIPANKVPGVDNRRKLNAFFFWASWAASTNRPGEDVTYTQNWPPEPLINNRPTGSAVVWSVISFVLLLAGIGGLVWYYAANRRNTHEEVEVSESDPLLALNPTPSMQATLKYFWVVMALIVAQVGLGAVTAHYGVEGSGFYGIPLAEWLPYSVTRTWHTQLAIFWIATALLATGLFIAPAISGYEPPYQRAGVNALFVCLLVIVVGSLAGEWASIVHHMNLTQSFWFGTQGYEYLDL
jgi:nitric oxide reductase subunit B